MSNRSLPDIIKGCCQGREAAYKMFYEHFHGYALTVCLAYANDRDDALEMMNDGFLKVFRNIKELKNTEVILPWLRRIMVNTAIDYHRKNLKRAVDIPMEVVEYHLEEPYLNDEAIFAQLSAEHILTELQQLPVPYRMVFSTLLIKFIEFCCLIQLAPSYAEIPYPP